MPPIKKERLYSEDFFLHYCELDEFSGRKLGRRVSSEFLRAAEKDELVLPLLVEKGKRKKEDGTEEEIDIRYYSPFQIFLVAALINNEIEDGELHSPDNWDWYKERGTRYITWGEGASSWVEHYKAKRTEEPQPMEYNIFAVADDFHKALRLVHGLPQEERYEHMYDNRRLFTGAPLLTYNLDKIREGGATYVEQYGLNAARLKRVIASVGHLATNLDPLERWFNYVQRHSRVRRDQLKGLASVAQDLYGFCDIAYELMELTYGEKLPPLLDFLHPDFKPYMMERAEYAEGEDIKAIRAAFGKLRTWVEENTDLIEELRPTIEREKLDIALAQADTQISDYEKRYGDRRYVGSLRTIWPETKLKLSDLDDATKKMVESMTTQRTKDEAVDPKERENLIALEITRAIEWRMGDLQRAVSSIAYRMAEATWPMNHRLDREKEMAKYPALEEFGKRVNRSDPDYARKHHEFWRTGIKEAERPVQEKIDRLDRARKDLHTIGAQTRLVLCAACRKNAVQRHYAHLDQQISHEAICDECIETEKKKAMSGTDEERKKKKYAEWLCDYCGEKVLLKFAVGNTISVMTLNKVPIQMSLKYGQMELQATCPKCDKTNARLIDWGWLA